MVVVVVVVVEGVYDPCQCAGGQGETIRPILITALDGEPDSLLSPS